MILFGTEIVVSSSSPPTKSFILCIGLPGPLYPTWILVVSWLSFPAPHHAWTLSPSESQLSKPMNSSQQAALVLVESKHKPSIVFKESLSRVTLGTDRAWDTEALRGTDKIIQQTASIRKNCPRAPWSLRGISSGCPLPIFTIFTPFLKSGCERFRLI